MTAHQIQTHSRFGSITEMVVGAMLLLQSGCTKSAAANAAIAGAVNVAAAVALHEATGSCYATCAYGTQCDHRTGTCAPIRPEVAPEIDPCAEECAIATQDSAAGLPTLPRKTPSSCQCPPPSPPASASDPCGGMCMADEKCVMKNGELGCE